MFNVFWFFHELGTRKNYANPLGRQERERLRGLCFPLLSYRKTKNLPPRGLINDLNKLSTEGLIDWPRRLCLTKKGKKFLDNLLSIAPFAERHAFYSTSSL